MMCKSPATIKITAGMQVASSIQRAALVPCGQCLNCRINQSRVWTNRILLEQTMHAESCFITLTYDDSHLPDPAWVSKREIQNYIKRLRWNVAPKKFRYFAVGEYGHLSWRPHYHVIAFGLDRSLHERQIRRSWKDENGKYLCKPERLDIGEVNSASARYITGYITKKIKKIRDDHPTSYGKEDEFRLSSTKGGGIGAAAAEKVRTIKEMQEFKIERIKELRVGRRKYPLGRYLEGKVNGPKPWELRLIDFKSMQEQLYDNNRKNIKSAKISYDRRKL